MIKVNDLIMLLKEVPDNAEVYAYEGEDTGLVIRDKSNYWFIRATNIGIDFHTDGFSDE